MKAAVQFLGILGLMLVLHLNSYAQKETKEKSSIRKVNKAAENLKKSLSEDDELTIAENYEKLAKELTEKGDHERAEEYLKKAKEIYTRLKNTPKSSVVTRGIARSQEAQLKTDQAIQNYQTAASYSPDSITQRLNLNDAGRLSNDNPHEQQRLSESNIVILKQTGSKEEISDAYKKLAESQLKQNNSKGAVKSLEKALDNSVSSKEVVRITKKIADVYVADKSEDQALTIAKDAIVKAVVQHDIESQVNLMLELATLYQHSNRVDSAEKVMQEAYHISRNSGNTLLTRDCVKALIDLYQQSGNDKKSLALYRSFTGSLDSIIKTDSSLIDAQVFELTEGRIKELEREKQLQADLIDKKNMFNYFLGGSVALLCLLLFFIMQSRNSVKQKSKKIALQSLRREMNPHFIFNSLNSVNQYIARNEEMEANKFLTSYSGLMRTVMEHSGKDFIPMYTEVEQLKKYLELEHQRFRDKFDYTIEIDETIDTDAIVVPNMVIQPHLENAVWHGLRYKPEKGLLKLKFEKQVRHIVITIQDNGIGLSKSKELKTMHQKSYQSRGLTNTKERIALLNDLYKFNIVMTMSEMEEGGTIVKITLPSIPKSNDAIQN